MTKEKDTLSERRGSLKVKSSSLKTGNVWELLLILWAKHQLCTCITLLRTFLWRTLHDYQTWNLLIRRFMEDVNMRGRHFPFSFWSWIKFRRIQVQQKSFIFDKFFQICCDKVWKDANSFFLATPFPIPPSSLLLKLPLVITSKCDRFFCLVRSKAGLLQFVSRKEKNLRSWERFGRRFLSKWSNNR